MFSKIPWLRLRKEALRQFGRRKKDGYNQREKTGKWEGFVKREGLVWRMIRTSRSIKDALKEKHITEAEINEVLTDDDRRNLDSVLRKLEEVQKKLKKAV